MKPSRACVAITALASLVSLSCYTQAVTSDTTPKHTSCDTFFKAIEDFPLNDVPFSKVDVGELAGRRVSGDAAIMKRIGGQVEFDSTFQEVRTGDFRLATPKDGERIKRTEKIEVAMKWSGSTQSVDWKLHIYPKAGSLRAWKALKPNAPIKFRAVVSGVTMYNPWIPGVHLRSHSILLEDAEIVSQ